jgi:hypothetical protein
MNRILGLVTLCVAASGCITTGNVQKAETLGKGRFQFGLEPGAYQIVQTQNPGTVVTLPHVDVSARYGISDGVDLGLRLGGSLIELQGKFQLTRPEFGSGFVASFAPTVGGAYAAFGEARLGYMSVNLPVLLGYHFSGGSELVFGPRIQTLLIFGATNNGQGLAGVLSPGASIGFAWQITEGFALMPEVSMTVPVVGSVSDLNGNSATGAGSGGFFTNFKLGLLFGGRRLDPVPSEAPPPPPPPRMMQPQPHPEPYAPPPQPQPMPQPQQPIGPPPPMPQPGPEMVPPPPPNTAQPSAPQTGVPVTAPPAPANSPKPVLVAPPPPRKP